MGRGEERHLARGSRPSYPRTLDEGEATRVAQPRVQQASERLRPTRAEVDLEAIARNYARVQAVAGAAKVLAVVKADAYGHGVVPVARRLEAAGAYGFGVALAEEAIELRDAGIDGEILVLNGVVGGAHREVLARRLVPVAYDLRQLEAFSRAADGRPFRVHLKVDTGMRRLGVPLAALADFLAQARYIHGLEISGLMTHLACADTDDDFTAHQLAEFAEATALVHQAGFRPTVRHVANSAGTFRCPEAHFNWVRPGIALFGHPGFEAEEDSAADRLEGTMRLRTEIITLKALQRGDRVGYDGAYVAPGPRTLAIIPMGYGDGLLRSATGAEVLVHGRRCPIVGRVSMDLTHIDVTDVPGAAIGDEVVLLGQQKGPAGKSQAVAEISAAELARAAGTAPYEVLTNVSRRVPRVYGV